MMPERTNCPNCGASVTPADAFCPECGHRQGEPGPGDATAAPLQDAPAPPRPGSPPPPPPPPAGRPPAFGAPPPHLGPRPTPAKGFFAGLFDFGFTTFVTPKVIKFAYVVITIIIGISWIVSIASGFRHSSGWGILALVFGPLVALLWLIVYRITFELVMVIFSIGSDVHTIRERSDLD
ncbi:MULTISPECIES: DUF4282 domain-containing protein [unclassified Streptomyces]|uniref:DUF4282 domain-containing protein n=1 Tax=unclassified Streptomyces TaxID=2593676 RepID=UPI0022519165|nr:MULTISPECIES: DUF4282 domain-containing protein [unclassified Streptomyces]MCX5287092.1 DUF4282 domain-containing protein [Streptomyces sp. NBC_00183]